MEPPSSWPAPAWLSRQRLASLRIWDCLFVPAAGPRGTLEGAILFRAMVPIVPDPLPALRGAHVLISNGRVDPLVPTQETDRLAALLRSSGADVTVHWHQAGHQLVHDDVTQAAEWLASLQRTVL